MKTALVTGASSGIGAACAVALADKGFQVCLTARREDRLAGLTARINACHGPDRAMYVAGDVTDEEAREETLSSLLSRWGRLDVLVNNAGMVAGGAVEELPLPSVRQQFEVNVVACLAWMQKAGPIMRQQRSGRIINISSISGRIAFPCSGAYAAAKFALEALSDAARVEYGPWGVAVIVIEPGSVVTEIWERGKALAESSLPNWELSPFRDLYAAEREHVRRMMEGKGPRPEIVARVVCRAATTGRPKARYCDSRETWLLSFLALTPTHLRDWVIRRLYRVGRDRPRGEGS
jgi:NAD(P)-dependent dehydrogenase (short-subunit alcohol dehydrogenase family)